MLSKSGFLLFLLLLATSTNAQPNLLERWINEEKERLGSVASDPDKYELQIIFTQIDRDSNNKPDFTTHTYHLNEERYFYPASTVKLPVAALALEKLNRPKYDGIDEYTPIAFGALSYPQTPKLLDHSAPDGKLTIAHLVRKIFLVSDNEAYNLLYSFVGQKEINEALHKKGYDKLDIRHRVGASSYDQYTNGISTPSFFYQADQVLRINHAQYNDKPIPARNLEELVKGKGYMDNQNNLINKSFDFTAKNYISLKELNELLIALIFPDHVEKRKRFDLTESQYELLYKSMYEFPLESESPSYDSSHYDSYVKFFVHGDKKTPMPKGMRMLNKAGLAYGYLTDVAYIIDTETQTEFFLSAVIHVNDNQIYNDNTYEYDQIGFPFLAELGRLILEKEKTRTRANLADFTQLKNIQK